MTDPLMPGDPVTLGSVRLLGRLGAGGMGRVYLGRTTGGRLVAVKTVHAHLAAEPHFRERFRREAAAARAVTGAHTAAVLDADPASPLPWLATAYLPGVTLRRAVGAAGPMDVAVVRSLGAALAEALTSIHGAGLVHRDLKPSNVLVTADGPRVIDFGIARALGDHGMTQAGDIIGTPGFIAPEQITDTGQQVTAAADVFALGAVLAFAATGRHPFGDGAVAILLYRAVHEEPDLDDVPAELRKLIAGCLRKEPGRRPSVGAVLERTADPGAPLWWREEPLRSLVRGGDATDAAAAPTMPVTALTEVTVPVPKEETAPRSVRPELVPPEPPQPRLTDPDRARRVDPDRARPDDPDRARRVERRRELDRRGVLLAGGGVLAGLLGLSVVRGWGDPPPDRDEGADDADGTRLTLKNGSATRAGALRWSLTARDGRIDALLLAGSALLLHGSDSPGLSGYVRACATDDGARRWGLGATDAVPAMWGVSDGTLVAPDVGLSLVALASGKARDAADEDLSSVRRWSTVADGVLVSAYKSSTDGKELHALDVRTGASRWKRESHDTQPPAVLGRTMLLGAVLGWQVSAVDAVSGKDLWTYGDLNADDDQMLAATALPDQGRFAVLTTRGRLHLIDARDGHRVAVRESAFEVTRGATALGGTATTGLLTTAGTLHAFDPDTARLLWSRPTLGAETSWPLRTGGLRGPVTADGLVLHWAKADTLQAVDIASGQPRWELPLTGIAKVPPVVAGDTVYAAYGERCTALRLTDGEPLRTWELPDIIDGLAADASGWYGRVGTSAVRAYNRADATPGTTSPTPSRPTPAPKGTPS